MRGFTKAESNKVKGIAVILLCMHHLFYSVDVFEGYEVKFMIFSLENMIEFSNKFGKICVALFIFITAYGLMVKIKECSSFDEVYKIVINRYITLTTSYSLVCIIFNILCATIFKQHNPFEIYGDGFTGVINFIINLFGLSTYAGTATLNNTWWYMSLAVTLIFIVPALIRLYKLLGGGLLLISVLLPPFMGIVGSDFSRYFFTINLGIFAADVDLFGKMDYYLFSNKITNLRRIVNGAIMFGVLMLFGAFRIKMYTNELMAVSEGLGTMLIVFITFSMLGRIPFLKNIFLFLGRHSMNIFFVHTFIFKFFFHNFIYSFKYGILILIALLSSSILVSIVIEKIKIIIRIKKMNQCLSIRLINLISKITF